MTIATSAAAARPVLPRSYSLPSPETLHKLLSYDSETGGFLWKERPLELSVTGPIVDHWNRRFAGKPALCSLDRDGYYFGRIFNRGYRAQRVAWAMVYGAWPNGVIDHIDGDRKNNRIINLRDVSQRDNLRNMARPKTNTSGVIGVSWSVRDRRWRAEIRADGRRINLGYFVKKDDAIAARQEASAHYGYHENHGRRS